MPLYQKFKSAFEHLIKGERKIAVAVSGGSDSMALTLLLAEYAKETGLGIIAITVDHGLRIEAADEAKQVASWLNNYGIEHHIICWQGDKKSSNIQALARKARYSLMADFCAAQNIKLLAVAHTMEDQAETVLMRIMRGSGVNGLAGIADLNEIFGICLIRPLLGFTRAALQEYLQCKNQPWIADPSNENTKYKRVSVRKLIRASQEPDLLVKRLAATAKHMARARDYIAQKTRESMMGVFTFHETGFYTIDTVKFKDLHSEERLQALAQVLQHVSGHEYRPRFENLNLLHENILNGNITEGCTLWGCEVAASKKKGAGNIIYIYREISQVAENIVVSKNVRAIWDGRFICEIGDLDIKNLYVGALGVAGYQAINKFLPFSINLPKKVIYTLPAFMALEKVLAVPHIGYYAEEQFKVAFGVKELKIEDRRLKIGDKN